MRHEIEQLRALIARPTSSPQDARDFWVRTVVALLQSGTPSSRVDQEADRLVTEMQRRFPTERSVEAARVRLKLLEVEQTGPV